MTTTAPAGTATPARHDSTTPIRHDRASTYRIAVGAGFAGDRYEPAEHLARRGDVDALVFECLAERTIALAQQGLRRGTAPGYDPRILRRLRGSLAPVVEGGGLVVTNAGVANPLGAARAVRDLARDLGLRDLPVAAVTGDDVLDRLVLDECPVLGTDSTLDEFRDRIVSANAYTGAAGIAEAIRAGARVVLAGRTADAALFLAPLAVRFGWDLDGGGAPVANGLLVGHLLECGGQLTGGYYADGPRKTVPDLARLGFPYADVTADGHAVYRKLPGTGGRLDTSTVVEQLLYEIEDPQRYVTPDGVLDLTGVSVGEVGPDEVTAYGATIVDRPEQLKVSVGIDDGFLASAGIVYAGTGCRSRAELAARVIAERWVEVHGRPAGELTFDLVGLTSARPFWQPGDGPEPPEVWLRASARTWSRQDAAILGEEMEALYTNGPAGGGGVTSQVRETVGVVSTLVPRSQVETTIEVLA
ncbi:MULTISPECIES: acyclic terpene utilization AtuA family protein [unclassified Micromonospora]|uniref:acyclic terpene utilization AtuA family protein n=1 Tax=unclassified Micromonospora TaxID=2617518 RepID=UPI003626424E